MYRLLSVLLLLSTVLIDSTLAVDACNLITKPNIQNSITTNYPGDVLDVKNIPAGIYWPVPHPSFTFDWPSSILSQAPTQVTYLTTTNVDYIVIGFEDASETVTLSDVCRASPCALPAGAGTPKKITIYLAPKDYRTNVTVTGLEVKVCFMPGSGSISILQSLCSGGGGGGFLAGAAAPIVNAFAQTALSAFNVVTLGSFSLDSQKKIRFTGKTELPYVEIDLETLGVGNAQFKRVELTQCSNVKYGYVTIWNQDYEIDIRNFNGVSSHYFGVDPTKTSYFSINFATDIEEGNRIRIEIVPGPNGDPSSTTATRFRYQALNIWIC